MRTGARDIPPSKIRLLLMRTDQYERERVDLYEPERPLTWGYWIGVALTGLLLWIAIIAICFLPVLYEVIIELFK